MFFSHKCHNCGMPVARRALKCLQCDVILREQPPAVHYKSRSKRELLAIICVVCSCVSFVLSFGLTSMYREGGLVWGMVSLALVLLTINWVRKLEQRRDDV